MSTTNTFFSYHYDEMPCSKADWRRMEWLRTIACTSDHKFRLGAALVRHSNTISVGRNHYRSSPRVPPQRFSIHAEADAIHRCVRADGATLYVARICRIGNFVSSRPCIWCLALAQEAGVERVVFSTSANISSFRLSSVKESLCTLLPAV